MGHIPHLAQRLEQGVPLQVTDPPLTLPGIWPLKKELKGEEPEFQKLPHPAGRGNYPSADHFSELIRGTFLEEVPMGMVEGPFSKVEAASRCEDLCPGPLAGIDEGDKIRTIYDGSVGGANDTIRNQTVERTTAPTVLDGVQALHWLHAAAAEGPPSQGALAREGGRQTSTWGLAMAGAGHQVGAVTKAHRRVKVLRKDWRFLVASLGEEWWVNKVGTYGMASAQSYWGRLAALLLRVLYALFPQVDWNFVFVDDFLWLLRSEGAVNLAVALLATLLALGTPLSWKNTHLTRGWASWSTRTSRRFSWQPTNTSWLWRFCRPWWKGRRCTQRTSRRPWVASAGEVDAPATLGLEDGHHHGGETPQGGQDAGVHAAVPLQHAFRPVLPLLAEVLLVGLQRC